MVLRSVRSSNFFLPSLSFQSLFSLSFLPTPALSVLRTGENVELMNEYYPVSNFDVVYMVDITPSLCEVARQRFSRLGWDNVKVLCMDAGKFQIPKEDGGQEGVEVALITMSYSRGFCAGSELVNRECVCLNSPRRSSQSQ